MSIGIRKRGNSYEASVYSKRDGKKIRKTFTSHAEAKSWRRETFLAGADGWNP